MKIPKQFVTSHRAKFSEIDPQLILNNEHYLSYFMEHRMTGLRENLGWDFKNIMKLPILFVVKDLQMEFKKPVVGDASFTITSKVIEVKSSDLKIFCEMANAEGKTHANCNMTVTAIDPATRRSTDWPQHILDLFFQES